MKKEKERWINDTQMFQRISGVKVSSVEDLSKNWDSFKSKKKRKFNSENAETNRIIAEEAEKAANNRRS